MYIGFGFDIHGFSSDRPLVLGGIEIPGEPGLKGHSDADCLLHALADALLGAAGLGDIGEHFPDTDPEYKGANSSELLKHCVFLLAEKGLVPVNADITVITEIPKLTPHKQKIRKRVADLLDLDTERINIKATTMEGFGPIGNRQALACQAAVLCTAGRG